MAVKRKPTTDLKTVNAKKQEKKVEEVRVPELTSMVGQLKTNSSVEHYHVGID